MIRLTANEARFRMINSMTDDQLFTQPMYVCVCVCMCVCVCVHARALIVAERVAYFCKIRPKVVSVESHHLYPNESKAIIALKQPDMAFTL